MKATPIPEDEASWVRSFSVLHDENLKALRAILERDAQGDTRGDPYGQKLGDVFTHVNETTLTLAGILSYGVARVSKSRSSQLHRATGGAPHHAARPRRSGTGAFDRGAQGGEQWRSAAAPVLLRNDCGRLA